MATINQQCASILDNLINSRLDFSIHQTPYSIHFSVRKKFSKHLNNTLLNDRQASETTHETEMNQVRQALLNTTTEYQKLALLENVKKEKNALSVVQKASKVDSKEHEKEFEKKKIELKL